MKVLKKVIKLANKQVILSHEERLYDGTLANYRISDKLFEESMRKINDNRHTKMSMRREADMRDEHARS